MLTTKKTIFFDMDGLLLDTETLYYETRKSVLATYGYDFNKTDHAKYVARGFQDTTQRLQKLVQDNELGQQIFTQAMNLYHQRLADGDVELKEGALELLEHLKQQNKKCYITSSSSINVIEQSAKTTGIAPYFDGAISGEEVRLNKPAPDIYNQALKQFKASRIETVVFEDAPSGVLSAYNADIDVVMVPDWVKPSEEIKDIPLVTLPNLTAAISLFN